MNIQRKIALLSRSMEENGLEEINIEEYVLFGLIKRKYVLSKAGAKQVIPMFNPASASNSAVCEVSPNGAVECKPVRGTIIKSPMVGVVYFSPSPDAEPFVKVGASVNEGDTLCLIEAMKTFTPVKAERAGVVNELIAKDGQVVEFESPLLVLE
jgi:acetyl-CoA carboxylase biotin carboxyl carrier protein